MSRDVRIQPTPEPTPTTKLKRASVFRGQSENSIPAITAATTLSENDEG